MADLEFFFDPVCPFAWVTSRWVKEVQRQRSYDVEWRFISLMVLNEKQTAEWYTPEYRAGHLFGTQGLRIADQARLTEGNGAVDRFYSALGTAIHVDRRRDEGKVDPLPFFESVVKTADLNPDLAAAAFDESHDAYIRKETELALARAGKDLGTPIVTFHPGTDVECSFFGPVVCKMPRDEDAVRLWDAVETLAATPAMCELKRQRSKLDFS